MDIENCFNNPSKMWPKRLNSWASGSVACVRRVFGSWSGDSEVSSHANAPPRQAWNAGHLRGKNMEQPGPKRCF
jgi:hypothetical protein